MTKNFKSIISSCKMIKSEINNLLNEKNLKDIQNKVTDFIKSAQEDIASIKDFSTLKRKIEKETRKIQKLVDADKIIQTELKKAKDFVNAQKKDLESLQKRVEKIIPEKLGPISLKKPSVVKVKSVKRKSTKKKGTSKN